MTSSSTGGERYRTGTHPMRFIDTHCHLHFPAYDADRESSLARLREVGGAAITIGTSLANSRAAIAFAEQHPDIWATVGLHPAHVTHPHHDENEGAVDERDVSFEELRALAVSSPKVVAMGEAGLDVYRVEPEAKEAAIAEQWRVFETHLNVAEELGLPVVVHCRDALRELARELRARRAAGHRDRCLLHSFTGTWAEAEPLLELGCSIALNGIVTFPPRKGVAEEDQLLRVAERVPLDRLVLETDAPYLAPVPHRGERNEPAWAADTAMFLAKVRGVEEDAFFAQMLENTKKFFSKIGL